ncbi:MAG: isopentenyl phosphate kinase [Thermoanaerobaculia bacterium]
MSRRVTLVKLGGSLITDKTRPGVLRGERLAGLARAVAAARSEAGAVVLGHGSGSFGHVEASRHGLDRPVEDTATWMGVARTQDRAAVLHRSVVEALLAAGLPTFSWAPGSALVAQAGRPAAGQAEPLVRALEAGLLPVVHGDVVMDRVRGACICSTETVFRFLVAELADAGWTVDRVLWMGETDGVWDADGSRIPVLEPDSGPGARSSPGGAARGTDVTGGMRHRVETALDLAREGVESWILDGREPARLADALRGEPRGGTRVPAKRTSGLGRA